MDTATLARIAGLSPADPAFKAWVARGRAHAAARTRARAALLALLVAHAELEPFVESVLDAVADSGDLVQFADEVQMAEMLRRPAEGLEQ